MSTTSRSFLVPSTQPITDDEFFPAYVRLQHRDTWVVQMLAEHQMLSTPQLVDLGFAADAAAAEKRLSLLVRRGWLNRFGPGLTKHWYSDDVFWCIGPYGAYYADLDDQQVSPARVYRNTLRLITSPRLSQLRATNQFFVDLAAYARIHPPTTDLHTWWSPRICSRTIASPRYKVWHGEYASDHRRVPFWLEVDDGYIRPATLAGHVHRYQPFAARSGIGNVLFLADTADRESELRRHLSHLNVVGLDVATSHNGLGNPATDVWLPLTGGPRRALHELPEHDLESGPEDLLPDLPERHLLEVPPIEDFINHPRLLVPHPIYDPDLPHIEAVADGEYA